MSGELQRPLRILVADDFEDTLELYALMLSRAGFQVVTASNGEEALSLAARNHFDAFILDVGLPKVNGLTVIRILRSRPETRRVPIITVSGAVGTHLHKIVTDAGADAVLDKPCLPEQLEIALRSCIEHRRALDHAREDPITRTESGAVDPPAARAEPRRADSPSCPETGYYVNGELRVLAVIAKGVRMPPGRWVLIADATVEPARAEELASEFVAAGADAVLPSTMILTEFDADEFERAPRYRAAQAAPAH